jgi:hypothetical protein
MEEYRNTPSYTNKTFTLKGHPSENIEGTPSKANKVFIMKGNPRENIEGTKQGVSQKRKCLFDLSRSHNAVDEISDEESTDMEEESDCEGTTPIYTCLQVRHLYIHLSTGTTPIYTPV